MGYASSEHDARHPFASPCYDERAPNRDTVWESIGFSRARGQSISKTALQLLSASQMKTKKAALSLVKASKVVDCGRNAGMLRSQGGLEDREAPIVERLCSRWLAILLIQRCEVCFTTRDLARCRIMARFIALIYNWWSLFVRLAEPDKHLEAITSRPLLLSAISERSRHARQTTLRVASSHAKAGWAASVLSGIAGFLNELVQSAEQLTVDQRWRRILADAARSWLGGRKLRPPPRLMAPA